jgi:LacI family transcriptional regulator
MSDVAVAAGVSQQTVSRVLNNNPAVASGTRIRVRAAVDALGYRRNMVARALVTGSSHVIGVMVSSVSLSGPSGILLSVEQTARANGYWVLMASLARADTSEVSDAVTHFRDQGVDGVVVIAQTQMAVDAACTAVGTMPTVLITSGVVSPEHSTVDIGQAEGARLVMTMLRGMGHTRIAHISGPALDLHAEQRRAAWAACLPAGLNAERLLAAGDWTAESGYRGALQLLAHRSLPTAIFAANDQMALGALRALHDRGLAVPRDMSVVGFDDIAGSECMIPPLTTVRQDRAAVGTAALTLLVEAIDGLPPRSIEIPAQPVVRASIGPARPSSVRTPSRRGLMARPRRVPAHI